MGRTFRRGLQPTDGAGLATFRAVHPEWHAGRTAHARFKVFLDRGSVLTGRICFPDASSGLVHGNVPPRGERRAERGTVNATDGAPRPGAARAVGPATEGAMRSGAGRGVG